MKIHHIGYLVRRIDNTIITLERLGFTVTKDIVLDDYYKVNICFLEKDGYVVELVSPVSKDSVVSDMIKRVGNAPYHICYETNRIEQDKQDLINQHFVVCNDLHTAVAVDNRRVCFLIHPYLGMVELLEAKQTDH